MVNLVRVTDKNLELAYKIQKEIFPEEPEYLFLKGAVQSDDKVLILESKSMSNLAKMVKNIAKNMGDKVEKFFKERNIANC